LKRIIAAAVTAAIFLIMPVICAADYSILLQNGGKFIVEAYWVKNGQIMFYHSGGIVGLDKKSVLQIQESDPVHPEPPVSQAVEKRQEILKGPPDQRAEQQPTPPEPLISDKKDDPVVKEFSPLKEKFKDVEKMDRQQLHRLADDLTEFRNTVVSGGSGHRYSDLLEQTISMLDEVESVLKAKDQ